MFKKLYHAICRLLSWVIPEYTVAPLLSTLAFQVSVYSGSKVLMDSAYHYNLETPLDLSTPFLPWTVVIYAGAFLYWYTSYALILRGEKRNAFRFLSAHVMSLVVILLCFLFLPTTNSRPEVTGHSLWDLGMRIIYATDTPTNLFPSLHCQFSWLCARALGNTRVPKWGKVFAYVFTLLIFVSTLTTKQHVIVDVLSGWLLAEVTFDLCRCEKVTRPFYRLFDRENKSAT